jgi:glycosyltransferase involved in cell wall biosynthesis
MKIVIQQSVAPDYRLPLFLSLHNLYAGSCKLLCGKRDFSKNIETKKLDVEYIIPVVNSYSLRRKFLFQRAAIKHLVKSDIVCLSYNLRIISNILVIWLRYLKRKPTLLWGHIDGRSPITRYLGIIYLKAASGFITYTYSQAAELKKRHPKMDVFSAANACFSAEDCWFHSNEQPNDVVFLGRLIEGKRPMLLLEAYRVFVAKRESKNIGRLVFIGEGSEKVKLEKAVIEHGLEKRVIFAGYISDLNEQRKFFSNALCSVSPGYVGLSVSQSLAFGVPVIVADDEPHSPEVEACQWGKNAIQFEARNVESLASTMAQCYEDSEMWLERRHEISSWTAENYSYERMVEAFQSAISCCERKL